MRDHKERRGSVRDPGVAGKVRNPVYRRSSGAVGRRRRNRIGSKKRQRESDGGAQLHHCRNGEVSHSFTTAIAK